MTPHTITKLAKVRRQVKMEVGGDGGRGIFLHGQLVEGEMFQYWGEAGSA